MQAHISRPLDVLARYGGEEFAAILYDVDARQARDIAERMRLAVSAMSIEHRNSRAGRTVTVSIGVAAIQPRPERGPLGALQLQMRRCTRRKSVAGTRSISRRSRNTAIWRPVSSRSMLSGADPLPAGSPRGHCSPSPSVVACVRYRMDARGNRRRPTSCAGWTSWPARRDAGVPRPQSHGQTAGAGGW